MNDLMTKSFLSYVDLKKQAMKDLESDVEMGQLDPSHELNLSKFFEEVGAVKAEMEEITNLLLHLQNLNEETKSAQSSKILRGLRDQINSDMVTVLRKAKIIKSRVESLDKSNVANRSLSADYREGSHVDRTRTGVTHGLRIKLKDMMNDFQGLRERIVQEHKEGAKARYCSVTGEELSDEIFEKMILDGGVVVDGKGELFEENQQRHAVVTDLQKSLVELHQVFLDMAVMVDAQADNLNNIEENVVRAAKDVRGGTKELDHANRMKRKRTCACWIRVVVHRSYYLSLKWLLDWGPKPMAKMKLGKDEARKAWLRDSLGTRNLKGDELIRSQIDQAEHAPGVGSVEHTPGVGSKHVENKREICLLRGNYSTSAHQ